MTRSSSQIWVAIVAGNPAFFLLKAMPDGRIAYGAVGQTI